MKRSALFVMACTVLAASAARANDEQFSICRVETTATWVQSNCSGAITPARVAMAGKLATFVDPTRSSTDCRRGVADAKGDIARMIAKSDRAMACAFYARMLDTVNLD